MTTQNTPPNLPAPPARRRHRGLLVTLWMVGVLGLSTVFAVPYALLHSFRLDREGGELRDSLAGSFAADDCGWSRMIEVRAGGWIFSLARMVSRFTDLPDEARAALSAARSAQVGVYQWRGADRDEVRRMIAGGPATIEAGGRTWTRIVSVRDGGESVAVLIPGGDADDLGGVVTVCVVVLDGDELIVVSAEVATGPIIKLVQPHLRELGSHIDLNDGV